MNVEGFVTYVIMYDPNEDEFNVAAGDATNVSETDVYFESEITLAEELVASLNNFHLKGKILVTKCDECGKYFVTGRAEAKKYAQSDKELPMPCRVCRKKV